MYQKSVSKELNVSKEHCTIKTITKMLYFSSSEALLIISCYCCTRRSMISHSESKYPKLTSLYRIILVSGSGTVD